MPAGFGKDFFKEAMGIAKVPLGEFMQPESSFGGFYPSASQSRGGFGSSALSSPSTGGGFGSLSGSTSAQSDWAKLTNVVAAERAKFEAAAKKKAAAAEQTQRQSTAAPSAAGAQRAQTPEGQGPDQLRAAIVARAVERFGESAGPVVNALLIQEGGLTGNIGDQSIGGSHGPFQFYVKGQLQNYARDRALPPTEAGNLARSNPMDAAEWAFDTYIGQALRQGISQGLTGPALLRQVLRVQNPGAVGTQHEAAYARQLSAPIPAYTNTIGIGEAVPPGTPARENLPQATGNRNIAWTSGVNQNDLSNQGLTPQQAAVFCGPAAAMYFMNQVGRPPTVLEALNLAKQSGWDEPGRGPIGGGMSSGPTGVVNLINRMGGQARVENYYRGLENRIRDEVLNGHPVLIDTPGHYYQVVGYDTDNGRFILGDAVGRRSTNGIASMQELASAFPQFGGPRSVIFRRE